MTSNEVKHDYYKVEKMTYNKGQGCTALETIPKGTLIFKGKPEFFVPISDINGQKFATNFMKTFNRLSDAQQEEYQSIHTSIGATEDEFFHSIVSIGRLLDSTRREDEKNRLKRIFGIYLNWNMNEECDEGHIYLEGSRFNHSCLPNALSFINPHTKEIEIRVWKKIEKGQDITLDYCWDLNSMKIPKARIGMIQSKLGFICECELCTSVKGFNDNFAKYFEYNNLKSELGRRRTLPPSLENSMKQVELVKKMYGIAREMKCSPKYLLYFLLTKGFSAAKDGCIISNDLNNLKVRSIFLKEQEIFSNAAAKLFEKITGKPGKDWNYYVLEYLFSTK